jgi:hypothetical protein
MKYTLLSLLCFIYIFQDTKSQEKTLDISGNFKIDHYNTFKKFNNSIISERNQGSFQTDISKTFTDKTKFFGSIEFREDLSNNSRNRIYPKEYYVDLYLKSADFRIGKQKYSWGRADGINPTNNLCPLDYSDFLDTDGEEIGQLSISSKFYVKDWTLQGVFIPVYSSAILPKPNTIWRIPLPETIPNPLVPGAYFTALYNYLPDNAPTNTISSGQFALKLDGRAGGIDFSTSYTRGYYNLPELVTQPSMYNMDTMLVSVKQVFIPRDVLGCDFATTLGEIGIRGEAAYFIPRGSEAKTANSKDEYLRYALGADFRKSIKNTSFYIIAQWLQEYVPLGFSYSSTSLNHLFQKSVMSRVEIDFRNIFTLSFQALYNFKNNDYYLQPKLSYKVSDGLDLILLADILDGDNKSLFGLYRNNDRIQLKIKYSF